MIFRNDDVSPATDYVKINGMYSYLRKLFKGCDIWSCINIFGQINQLEKPFDLKGGIKNVEFDFLCDRVNAMFSGNDVDLGERVSHGLIHYDHTKMGKEAQNLSILLSCNFLRTDKFLPPFSTWNEDTVDICQRNNINLVKSDGWKSLESESFDPSHSKWYFHSWNYTLEEFKELFDGIYRIPEKV